VGHAVGGGGEAVAELVAEVVDAGLGGGSGVLVLVGHGAVLVLQQGGELGPRSAHGVLHLLVELRAGLVLGADRVALRRRGFAQELRGLRVEPHVGRQVVSRVHLRAVGPAGRAGGEATAGAARRAARAASVGAKGREGHVAQRLTEHVDGDDADLVEEVEVVDVALVHEELEEVPSRVNLHGLELPGLEGRPLVGVEGQLPQALPLGLVLVPRGFPPNEELNSRGDAALVAEDLHLGHVHRAVEEAQPDLLRLLAKPATRRKAQGWEAG